MVDGLLRNRDVRRIEWSRKDVNVYTAAQLLKKPAPVQWVFDMD